MTDSATQGTRRRAGSVASEALLTVAAGQVTQRRLVNGDAAPDFYRYRFFVDGHPADAAVVRALTRLEADGVIRCGSYAGQMGPVEVPVRPI